LAVWQPCRAQQGVSNPNYFLPVAYSDKKQLKSILNFR